MLRPQRRLDLRDYRRRFAWLSSWTALRLSWTSPRMTEFSHVPAAVPGPRLGPGINPGHASACARTPRIPLDRRYDTSLRSACPENRFPLFGADLETGNTGHSILHRCLYFIGAQLSGPSGGDCTLPRSPGLVSGRTACPRQGSGRSPCKKKRKRPVETDCPSASTRVVQYARIPPGGGVGCP
jgi:hypothetical protein